MKIGCVATSIDEANFLTQLGYDYIEIKGDMLLGGEKQFAKAADSIYAFSIPIEAMTSPLPRSLGLKIVGSNANLERCVDFFDMLCSRAVSLGVKVITFGAGQARYVEAGFSRQQAYEQLERFLSRVADICCVYNVMIAIETLNHTETNILNTTAESRQLVERVNRPEINMLIDYYHVFSEGLSLDEECKSVRGHLVHVHTADLGRRYPGSAPEFQKKFLDKLRNIGYTGRVSVECLFNNFEQEAKLGLQYLRKELSH